MADKKTKTTKEAQAIKTPAKLRQEIMAAKLEIFARQQKNTNIHKAIKRALAQALTKKSV